MRIVAAMSGGVDSSVAALLLKKQGHEVIGVTIKTWPKAECGAEGEKLCCSLESIQFARSVAEEIGIPFYVVDLSAEFTKEVRDYFAAEYAKGRTPNPCVYCNSRIKFGHLMRKAKEMGAEKIATGHYAQIRKEDGKSFLFEAADKHLDQSYFLCDIPSATLEQIEFPLGEMNKEGVRKLAAENNLMTAYREASQDICFAYLDGGYREYLAKAGIGTFTPGDIIDVNGKAIGKHKGIASYTIGQRRGIGLGMPEPVYVIGINPGNNTITVGTREHAMKSKIRVERFNWYIFDRLEGPMEFDTVIRYNGDRVRAVVTPCGPDAAIVEFKEPQFAPTPGQAAVFYEGEKVAGGAWIEEILT